MDKTVPKISAEKRKQTKAEVVVNSHSGLRCPEVVNNKSSTCPEQCRHIDV